MRQMLNRVIQVKIASDYQIVFFTDLNTPLVSINDKVSLLINDSTHYFNVQSIDISTGLHAEIEAVEIGFWGRRLTHAKNFDVMTLIGMPINIVTDDAELEQIALMSSWC